MLSSPLTSFRLECVYGKCCDEPATRVLRIYGTRIGTGAAPASGYWPTTVRQGNRRSWHSPCVARLHCGGRSRLAGASSWEEIRLGNTDRGHWKPICGFRGCSGAVGRTSAYSGCGIVCSVGIVWPLCLTYTLYLPSNRLRQSVGREEDPAYGSSSYR